MSTKVRVRFAPSPTGFLHIGGLRSALFSWLFARQNKGSFILRIEDTDRSRYVPESIEQIKASLEWLGLHWDEGPGKGDYGPYIQSERIEIYTRYAKQLLDSGKLYKDYTPSEKLAELRKQAQKEKRPFRFNRELAQTEPSKEDDPFVLRFRIEPGEVITWDDEVWGKQSWNREVLEDFVAIKSDGFPTYQFANVIDDHEMAISHVIRAAEWIPSTPKHILLYEAFGWEKPIFAHLPQVLGPDKAKLSKRHGAKSALEYKDEGYLPEAVMNFLALLGWNPGKGSTQEIFSPQELIESFSLKRVQSSPAVFDPGRLEWMNGVYIRNLVIDKLLAASASYWPKQSKGASDAYRKQVLKLVQERLKWFGELEELTDFFFKDPETDPQSLCKSFDKNQAINLLQATIKDLGASDFSIQDLESTLRKLTEKENVKTGQLFTLIRHSITGKTAAPGLFETLNTLGKEASLRRLESAKKTLES